MEKKIINLTKAKEDYGCIICCNNHATTRVEILRLIKAKNDSLIIFNVCDNCLAQMQGDIQKICE
jgi:CRISPR/Cas system-associated endoribonuclease Cas2